MTLQEPQDQFEREMEESNEGILNESSLSESDASAEEIESEAVDVPADEETNAPESATDNTERSAAEKLSPATEEAASPETNEGPAWYVIHCYSGYENKVRHNLEQRIETMGMKDRIFDVVIPTQEEIEVKDGKRRTVERHIFPGYVLVNMLLTEESWYVVRNTPGVTGFVGMGNNPTPLSVQRFPRGGVCDRHGAHQSTRDGIVLRT